ncbi:MAG: hypothetical protein FWB74_08020, partial [Defluviitaleaceae bacterium]|nr:hypothetical protein [Defluviitaleaceae bacterium]
MNKLMKKRILRLLTLVALILPVFAVTAFADPNTLIHEGTFNIPDGASWRVYGTLSDARVVVGGGRITGSEQMPPWHMDAANNPIDVTQLDFTAPIYLHYEEIGGNNYGTLERLFTGWHTSINGLGYFRFDGVDYIDMSRAFMQTHVLQSIDLSSWFSISYRVVNMTDMFNHSGITSLNLSGWDNSAIEPANMARAFNGTNWLTQINLGPNFVFGDARLASTDGLNVGYFWHPIGMSDSYLNSNELATTFNSSMAGIWVRANAQRVHLVTQGSGTLTATVRGTPIEHMDFVPVGSPVEFIATPDSGHEIDRWFVQNNLVSNFTGSTRTETVPVVPADPLIGLTGLTVQVNFQPAPTPPVITVYNAPNGTHGISYSFQFVATGNPAPTWSYTGDLPDGLSLSAGGLLSGTPDEYGSFTFTVVASNGVNPDDSQFITIEIDPPLPMFEITFYAVGNGTLTATANGEIILNGAEVVQGSTVVFVATPDSDYRVYEWLSNDVDVTAEAINNTFTITSLDEDHHVTVEFEFDYQEPYITEYDAPNGFEGVFYSFQFVATGRPAPVWSVADSDDLPDGLALNSQGLLSGTPTETGDFTFRVIATNSVGSVYQDVTINIGASFNVALVGDNIRAYLGDIQINDNTPIPDGAYIRLVADFVVGYRFLHWLDYYADEEISDLPIYEGFAVTENVTIHGIFETGEPLPSIAVDPCVSAHGTTTMSFEYTVIGGGRMIRVNLNASASAYFEFDYWYVYEDEDDVVDIDDIHSSETYFLLNEPTNGVSANFMPFSSNSSIVIIGNFAQTFTVTINGGGTDATGSGSFRTGAPVSINAGSRPGYTFRNWTTTTPGVTFANANSASTIFTMPASNVTVTANWDADGNGGNGGNGTPGNGGGAQPGPGPGPTPTPTPTPTMRNLTVNNLVSGSPVGNGVGQTPTGTVTRAQGTTVNINAGTRAGHTFNGWTSSPAGLIANPNSVSTSFVMPNQNVTITANWVATLPANHFWVNIVDVHNYVTIANRPQFSQHFGTTVVLDAGHRHGFVFSHFSTNHANVYIVPDNFNPLVARFTMPHHGVTVFAHWIPDGVNAFTVEVLGSNVNQLWGAQWGGNIGVFAPGQVVTVRTNSRANDPFLGWSSWPVHVNFANQSALVTSFIMPAHDVIIEANWQSTGWGHLTPDHPWWGAPGA